MMGDIVVVSPHPDDESIGCGGTIRRHVEAGDRVTVVFLTSGERGWPDHAAEETARVREGEAEAAAAILGVAALEFWRQPDADLQATDDLAERLCATFERLRPSRVYTTHADEMHADHRAAAAVVSRAHARAAGAARREAFGFEVWTPLQRLDDLVDITTQLPVKLAAIGAHRTQCDLVAFDAAAEGLARYRGELHLWPGGPYAEAFVRLDPAP